MEYLGNQGHLLYGEFVYTLSDDSIAVVEAVVPHLTEILQVLVQGKVVSPDVMVRTWNFLENFFFSPGSPPTGDEQSR